MVVFMQTSSQSIHQPRSHLILEDTCNHMSISSACVFVCGGGTGVQLSWR